MSSMLLPSAGPYALVYTDMDASTATNERLGDQRARDLMRRHDRTVRDLLARHDGRELTHLGDGFKLVFPDARRAIDFAVALQRALAEERAAGEELSVRVGVHVGEAIAEGGDLFGRTVIVAARIMSRAHAAQILISETAAASARDAGVPLVDRGLFLLKGIRDGVRLFEVEWRRDLARRRHRRPPAPRDPRVRPPLVGRQAELAELERALEDAERRAGSFVVVTGDPGIGKTRLCTQFLEQVAARGLALAVGRCREGNAEPYAPIFDCLEQLAGHGPLRAPRTLSRALGPLARAAPGLAASLGVRGGRRGEPVVDEEPARFQSALAALLEAWAREHPIVVLLDDLQWLDPASLEVVRGIGRRMVRGPSSPGSALLVVATLRQTGASDGVAALLRELHRDRVLQRLALAPLATAGVRALATDLLRGHATEDELSRIETRSQGNPYFVEELCRDLAERQGLTGRKATLEDDAASSASVPEQLKSVLEERLARLSDQCLAALRVAALLEPRFRYDVWRVAAGVDDETILACAEEAVSARLLQPVSEQRPLRYAFAHVLVAEVLRDTTSAPRRQRLHLSIADALEQLEAGGPVEIAGHLVAAGEAAADERVARWCTHAVSSGAALHAPREAARLLAEALAARERLGLDGEPESDALRLLLARAFGQLGKVTEAAALTERAVAALERRGEQEAADRARARLAHAYIQHALPDEALRVLAPVVERSGPTSPARGAVLAEYAVALDLGGDAAGMRETARTLIRLARRGADAELSLRGLGVLRNWYANHSPRLDRALSLSRQLLDAAQARRDPWGVAAAAADVGLFELVTGRVRASLATLERGLGAAERSDAIACVLNIRAVRALAFCFRGEWEGVAAEWSRAEPLLGRVPGALRTGLLLWACVRRDLWLGRPGPALPSAEQLYGGIAQFQRDVLAGAGLVAAERRAPQAEAILRRASEFQTPSGVGVNWLTAAQSIAAGWAELENTTEAAPWAEALAPYRGTLLVGSTDLVLGRIARLAGRREDAERELQRALRLARRESLHPLLALVRREQALLWSDGGTARETRRAAEADAEYRTVSERLGMQP